MTEENLQTPEPATDATGSRRRMLQFGGVAALGVAMAALPRDANADPNKIKAGDFAAVDTVTQLLTMRPNDGATVIVAGYRKAGDGGSMILRFDAKSTATANGGTVLGSGKKGRWIQLHDGVMDFRKFGIMGPDAPADAALDAMLADPSIQVIEAHSDLNFVKRHIISRSGIEIDFHDHVMTTKGIELAAKDDPFAAVLFFKGKVGKEQTHKLTAEQRELVDVFEVGDSSFFKVGNWYAVESDARPGGGKAEQELMRLVECTEVLDGTHVRVGYKNGWALPAGRTLKWREVEPVRDVLIRRLQFRGVPGTDMYTGSHPIAFEYAIRCDVEDVHAVATFWPMVMRRWCTFYRTIGCSLNNPVNVVYGGAGYLTQQISCLYGHVADCRTSNARHLNDFTASAYSYVENCHGDGDLQGPFVTHGQYEHDLTYVGNSGLMTFANSGPTWGGRAKRITVTKHVAPLFFARVGVTDLTIEDVEVVRDPSMPDYPAWMWLNADGLQVRGCRVDGRMQISQVSKDSKRPNVIAGTVVGLTDQLASLPLVAAQVSEPIHFSDCRFIGLSGATAVLAGSGALTFTDCTLEGADGATPLSLESQAVTLTDTNVLGVALVAAGSKDQKVTLVGSRLSGLAAGATAVSRAGAAKITWRIDGVEGSGKATHLRLDGGVNQLQLTGSRFDEGSVELADAAFAGGWALISANVFSGTTKVLPAPSTTVLVEGNLG